MDDEETNCIDRISGLPDFILHRILSYLMPKEAARTGVISKRWRYVWETYPIFHCFQGYFGRNLGYLNPKEFGIPKDERRKIYNQRLKFMSYIDERLLRLRKENLCVKKFTLDLTLISKALDSRVDTWMGLLADLCIQELYLFIQTGKERLHDLSKILFSMESLTILRLSGLIQLSSSLGRNAVKLHSLVELNLRHVYVDEDTIQDLIFSCRSMKVFFMSFCFGFENLDIYDHNKLEKVQVAHKPSENFKLKRISIKVQTFILIEAKWLQRMLTSFPLLEHLHLEGCIIQEVMKLSGQALKKICIRNCKNLVEAEFDAPNLQSFEYRGVTMPRLYFHSVAGYRKADLFVDVEDVDSLWFIRLNNFLRDISFQDLSLKIPNNAISFNAEEYTSIQFPPFELNNMKLFMPSSTSINYAALLNGLFWNLRPRVLSLILIICGSESVKELLKCLGAEEPCCYCSEKLECWRHALKEIKLIDNVIGLKRDTVFNAMTLDNFTNCLDDWVTEVQKKNSLEQLAMSETLSFRLSWC